MVGIQVLSGMRDEDRYYEVVVNKDGEIWENCYIDGEYVRERHCWGEENNGTGY